MLSYPFTSRVTYDDQGLPLYDRAVDSSFLRQVFSKYFSDGVHYEPTNALQIVVDTGMNVKAYAGTIHIQGAIGIEPVERTLAVQSADMLDRIDSVVARLDLSTEARNIDLYIVKGVPSESPVRPELTRNNTVWELGLADLFIAKNTSTISQERITDTRLENERCGLMGPNIARLDTTPYYEQIIALGKLMEREIDNIKNGSDTMLKSVYDKTNTGVVDNSERLGGYYGSIFDDNDCIGHVPSYSVYRKTGQLLVFELPDDTSKNEEPEDELEPITEGEEALLYE